MSIKPEFEHEDEWEDFLHKTDVRNKVKKEFRNYSWTFGKDEDDDGFMRECVILEIGVDRETEPRHVAAKLTSSSLMLKVRNQQIISDRFMDTGWLNVEDSYWELETKTDKTGERKRNIRYILCVRTDFPKYISSVLFEREKLMNGCEEVDDDSVQDRLETIGNLKEPEPHRDDDIYFSEDDEFSEPECEACGSRSVHNIKKANDKEFKVHCDDCPHVSLVEQKLPRSVRRQRVIDEARARKRKEQLAHNATLALDDDISEDLAKLREVD